MQRWSGRPLSQLIRAGLSQRSSLWSLAWINALRVGVEPVCLSPTSDSQYSVFNGSHQQWQLSHVSCKWLWINTDTWVPFVGGWMSIKPIYFDVIQKAKAQGFDMFWPPTACDLLMVTPKHGWSTKAVGGGIVIQYGYAHKYVHMWIKKI